MILSHDELVNIIRTGVLEGAKEENVNGSSIDITLSNMFFKESLQAPDRPVDLQKKEAVQMEPITLTGDEDTIILNPGEFLLACSEEIFHLPLNLSAEYKLKSSMARSGINHMLAGWCDPGWTGRLTLELHNVLQHHAIALRRGMKIGQVIFLQHESVGAAHSYATRGQYQGTLSVTRSRGVR